MRPRPLRPTQGTLQPYDKVQPQEFPWGWIRWVMNAQIDPQAEMTLGVVQINANQSNPVHVHPNCTEYLHVLSGSCEHRVGRPLADLESGRHAAHSPGRHACRPGPRPNLAASWSRTTPAPGKWSSSPKNASRSRLPVRSSGPQAGRWTSGRAENLPAPPGPARQAGPTGQPRRSNGCRNNFRVCAHRFVVSLNSLGKISASHRETAQRI